MLATGAAKLDAKIPQGAFGKFFDKPINENSLLMQETKQPDGPVRIIGELKSGGWLSVNNFANEYGKVYNTTMVISPSVLSKAAGRTGEEEAQNSEVLLMYNSGGIPILIMKHGVVASREGRGSRDQIDDLWESAAEIVSGNAVSYGKGKDKWAIITVTDVNGKESKLVLFIEQGVKKILREFDLAKDTQ